MNVEALTDDSAKQQAWRLFRAAAWLFNRGAISLGDWNVAAMSASAVLEEA